MADDADPELPLDEGEGSTTEVEYSSGEGSPPEVVNFSEDEADPIEAFPVMDPLDSMMQPTGPAVDTISPAGPSDGPGGFTGFSHDGSGFEPPENEHDPRDPLYEQYRDSAEGWGAMNNQDWSGEAP